MSVPNYVTLMFEGGQGYKNGNFQDPMRMGQNRRVNKPVFKPDPLWIDGRRNINEPIRKMDNFPQPHVALVANPLRAQPVQQTTKCG